MFKFCMMMMVMSESVLQVMVLGDFCIILFGKFFCVMKFDELLQLFNVVCGEMCFVGFCFEVLCYVDFDDLFWQCVLVSVLGFIDLMMLWFCNEELFLVEFVVFCGIDVEVVYCDVLFFFKLQMLVYYFECQLFWSDGVVLFCMLVVIVLSLLLLMIDEVFEVSV